MPTLQSSDRCSLKWPLVPASYDASAKSARDSDKHCERIDAVLAKDEDQTDFVPGVGGARAKTTQAACEPLGPSWQLSG